MIPYQNEYKKRRGGIAAASREPLKKRPSFPGGGGAPVKLSVFEAGLENHRSDRRDLFLDPDDCIDDSLSILDCVSGALALVLIDADIRESRENGIIHFSAISFSHDCISFPVTRLSPPLA